MRSRISMRGWVRRTVRRSVRPSHMSEISEKSDVLTEMEQNSTKNMKLYHLKDNSDISTQCLNSFSLGLWLKIPFAPMLKVETLTLIFETMRQKHETMRQRMRQ